MSNEPVAWMYACNGIWTAFSDELPPDDAYDEGTLTPLYTHPADESFDRTASHMAGEYVSYPEKTLTDEEILALAYEILETWNTKEALIDFARAILRKAQEK